MLQVLASANLVHQLVFVPVHAGKLANVVESVENAIGELESIDIAETVLDLRVDNELGQAKDLAHEMEGIAEAGLFAFFGGECFNRLQIKIVYAQRILVLAKKVTIQKKTYNPNANTLNSSCG